MKVRVPNTSVFVVDSTYQLLNAVEAVHFLAPEKSYLVILKAEGPAREAFWPVISLKPWNGIRFLTPDINTDGCDFRILGPRLNAIVRAIYSRFQHLMLLLRVARTIKSLSGAENLFLGHYWLGPKDLMRHFANRLEHRTLYLLDDGTDTIDTNDRRRQMVNIVHNARASASTARQPIWNSVIEFLRRKYWMLDTKESEVITFFSTYEIKVRNGDHLIRNDYRLLRSIAAEATRVDEVYFLGQCLVDDAYMEERVYLEYLREILVHYEGRKIYYVAHPRESSTMLARVRDLGGFELKRFKFPIEYELTVGGILPTTLASFFCSALESCFQILGGKVEIMGFYLDPSHLLKMHDIVAKTYAYFERRKSPGFAIIRLGLDRQGARCIAGSSE